MNWMELATPMVVVTALSGGGKFYADNTYVLVSDSLQGQLFQLERDIKRMELSDDLTPEDEAYLRFLELQADQLREELD